MNAQELGDLLIKLFDGYSFKEVIALSKGDKFEDFLISKVGEKECKKLDRLDGTVWMDALRMLYFHYGKKK